MLLLVLLPASLEHADNNWLYQGCSHGQSTRNLVAFDYNGMLRVVGVLHRQACTPFPGASWERSLSQRRLQHQRKTKSDRSYPSPSSALLASPKYSIHLLAELLGDEAPALGAVLRHLRRRRENAQPGNVDSASHTSNIEARGQEHTLNRNPTRFGWCLESETERRHHAPDRGFMVVESC